jgi:8-oxo-dGTP pyrophosphatase MutT (NUDIX family)
MPPLWRPDSPIRAVAVCVRANSDLSILLVRTRRGGWTFPGGRIEPGETPAEAAGREALEEGGVTGRISAEPFACFIQDGIKFPDIIHAVKPEPDREIPQAQTAHDTFWDFVSLTPESTHMLMWIMSDRAIPRSLRTMEGFGVHTFRLYNESGATTLVKFHWKPAAGVHSLAWEESQKLGGIDPDFHRRDLWDTIESGGAPRWDLGVQLFEDNEDQSFEGIDLLDPTKLVPEELAPVRIIGRLTLDLNPTNYFAETEQVAFCTAHVPRGIDFTDDPLLQARNFSYLDTQLTRLGGPNFAQLPINRPRSPANANLRDGFGQQVIHEGVAPYFPNSLGAGCPFHVGEAGFQNVPREVSGTIVRERPQSFDDHYTQATMFWNSMTSYRARPHRGRVLLRARKVRPSRDPHRDAGEPRQRGCRVVWAHRRQPGEEGTLGSPGKGCRLFRCSVAGRHRARPHRGTDGGRPRGGWGRRRRSQGSEESVGRRRRDAHRHRAGRWFGLRGKNACSDRPKCSHHAVG